MPNSEHMNFSTYKFPEGACEKAVHMFSIETGSHPVSASINFVIVCILIATWRSTSYKTFKCMKILLASEIIFESVHGLCHLKHDTFYGQCFAVQHATGITMLLMLAVCVEVISMSTFASYRRHLVAPILCVAADVTMCISNTSQMFRIQITFVMFSVIFIRATRSGTKLIRAFMADMRLAAAAMLTETVIFYMDGNHCSSLEDYVPFPPHAILECIGAFIFVKMNSALTKALRKDE